MIPSTNIYAEFNQSKYWVNSIGEHPSIGVIITISDIELSVWIPRHIFVNKKDGKYGEGRVIWMENLRNDIWQILRHNNYPFVIKE